MTWCEACRDHFDKDHFDQPWESPTDGFVYENGAHGVGPEYGPVGISLWKEEALEQLLVAADGYAGGSVTRADFLGAIDLAQEVVDKSS
jgi:hypothetical protein